MVRILKNNQVIDYLYNIYHYSSETNTPITFYYLLKYGEKNGFLDKDFFDSKAYKWINGWLYGNIPSLTLFRLKIAANADSYCVCGFYTFFVKSVMFCVILIILWNAWLSQSLQSRHHSFRLLFSFLMDCVVIKLLSPKLLNRRFASDDNPASVHTTNLENSKLRIICCSRGFSDNCSFWFPGLMQKARGIPDLFINNPICTIGLGLCSLLGPYCINPSSCSSSKK